MNQSDSDEATVVLAAELAEARAEIAELKRSLQAAAQASHDGSDPTGNRHQEPSERAFSFRESQRAAGIGSYKLDFRAGTWASSEVLDQLLGIDAGYRRTLEGWLALIHPDDQELINRYLTEEVIARRKPFVHDYRIVRQRDRETRWVHGRGELEFDEGGIPVSLIGTAQDITERKQAEEALRSSEQQLRAILEQSPLSMAVVAMDGTIEYLNRRAVETFGYPHEDIPVMDRWWEQAYPDPSYRAEVLGLWMGLVGEALTLGRDIERREYRVTCKDGSVKTTDIFGVIVAGKVLVMFDDVTKRKQAEEEALRESEANYRLLFTQMQEGCSVNEVITDKDGKVVDFRLIAANAAYERHTGITVADAIGKTLLEILPHADRRQIAVYGEVALGGEPRVFEYLSQTFGRHFRVQAFCPQPGRFATLFEDITESKRAEEERAKLEQQLHQVQKMESVGQLAGGVAHDFNNMLAVILGHTEMALEQVDPASPLHEDLEVVRMAGRRSADLTRQLLAFARRQTVAPKVLDLNEVVTGILAMLGRLIGEDIRLGWQPAAGLWPLKVDPSQIDQLLTNLCVNARDAIKGVGRLTIETANVTLDLDYCAAHLGAVPGDYVRLAVSDDGCGMDQETQQHLFEPFFTTKERGKGTGLGLATVYGVVKQNHGYINVYSEPGHGTTFTIYLPRHQGTSVPVRTDGAAEPSLGGRETLLLVEDEAAILRMTKTMLERLGYVVLSAGTPGAAIRLAEQHAGEIHLLVTDVIMPEMNGRDLARNLLTRYPGMKRLFMSGYTADVIASHGVLDEGVNFIQKPFSKGDLSAKVREALGRD